MLILIVKLQQLLRLKLGSRCAKFEGRFHVGNTYAAAFTKNL